MRKNRTKHEAKKPRLAKRALALCFALIFVCSCLLPAFANSEGTLPTDPLTMEQQDEQPTDPVLLNEGGEDSTEGGEQDPSANNPTEGGEQDPSANNPTEGNEQQPTEPEQPKNEDSTKQQGNEQTKPEEPKTEGTTESKDSTEEQPKNEGTTGETTPEETKPEGTTEETKPEEPKQPTTNTTGDTIEQGEATYTYRFWPDKIDAFDLEAINADVKSGTSLNDAAQSRAGMVPCTVLTVMTNANLRDYQANVQQPTKPGYEFAGWYTVDGTTEDKFSFEQSLNFEKSKTIDVFAKWNELKAVESDTLSEDGMTVKAKVGPMANVKSVTLAEPSQSDAETLRKSIDKDLYGQSYMVAILDITPKDENGMTVEPQNGESVNVEISGLGFSAGDEGNVWVYHLTKSGRVETLYATVTSDGGVSFATKSFSPFAVVKLTESMVAFDTGDDRLAPADLYKNLTMTVGETQILRGSGYLLLGTHSWKNSNSNVVTVRENGGSATVEAISAGSAGEPATATVTHNYDGAILHYEDCFNITVNEVTSSFPLYVYVKMSNQVKDMLQAGGALTPNENGWFTLGWVEKVDGLCDPETYNGGHDPNPKLQGKYSMYNSAVASLKNIQRWKQNGQVDWKTVKWDHEEENGVQFGLTTANGAADYHSGASERMWHLDGYIDKLSAVVVNYYIDDGTQTKIKESSTHLGTPGEPYKLTIEKSIEHDGHTYEWERTEPQRDTWNFPEQSGGVETINLYYRDTSVSYPLYVYVKMSDTVKNKLETAGGNRLTINKDGWFTLGKVKGVQGLGDPKTYNRGESPNPKLKTGDKYNKAVASLVASSENPGIQRYNKNEQVNLDDVKWDNKNVNGEQFGLTTAKGAADYFDETGYDRTWHLDGYIESLSAVVVNYYLDDGNDVNPTSIKTSETHLGSPGKSYKLAAGEKLDKIEYEGQTYTLTYKRTRIDPVTEETKFPESGEVANINLYYTAKTNLTVTKTATKDDAVDNVTPFKFTLTLGDASKGVTWTKGNEKGSVNGKSCEFTLKGGESITFSGINVHDTDVKVEEADYSAQHYTTTVDGRPGHDVTISTETLKQNQTEGTTVSFVNAYTTPRLDTMTIKKQVTGAFGERTKPFTFRVTLTNSEVANNLLSGVTITGVANPNGFDSNHQANFQLQHNQQVTLKNIPIDTIITITESDADDYKTSATGHKNSISSGARTFTYKVEEDESGNAVLKSLGDDSEGFDGTAITVENNFDGTPDTGVLLDTLPYLILLAVAVAGGVLVVVRKRKHRDE